VVRLRAIAIPRALRTAAACVAATTLAASTVLSAPLAAEAAPACGRTLNVVAHEDDDLLFINPAVSDDIAAGRCVVTLFVTAGDAGKSRDYWHRRETGSMAAYAAMAGVPDDWFEDTMVVAGHTLTRLSLIHTKITLLFMRLPDAHGNATRPLETLQKLWEGQIETMYTLDSGDVYTRQSLTGTLTAVMDAYQPGNIRTLDYAGAYGDGDHADHHTVGYLTYAAQRNYRSPHRVSGYMGYPIENRPPTLSDDVRDAKLTYFLAYAPFDPRVCQAYADCLANFYAPRFTRSVITGAETGGGRNVAAQARAHASSANFAARQQPAKAIDGTVSGAPAGTTHEWATDGGRAGSWISLTWTRAQSVNQVDLSDRPNATDQVTAGLLQFSDGTAVRVGPLPNDGSPKVIRFRPRRVTALRFTITAVSPTTRSTGLAEVRAYAADS
jgi:LmbE family N-acetylglucosaminyl deacetylase